MIIKLIPDPFPYEEELATANMRHRRDAMLNSSDWTQTLDAPLTDEQRAAWATYRQALRDFPATWTAGPTAEFPDPPGVS
jgi:hypothetical protein